MQDQSLTIQTLECERNKLREQYAELCQRLDHMEGENVSTVQHKRLELKIRELESKLELERTTKTRMDTQVQHLSTLLNMAQLCSIFINITQHGSTWLNIALLLKFAQHCSTSLNMAQHSSTMLKIA